MTLAQDMQTVKEWCRSAVRKAERGADTTASAAKAWATGPVPDALKATRGHDYDASRGTCSCGKVPADQSYREHLVRVLDTALFLRTPAYVKGEGW